MALEENGGWLVEGRGMWEGSREERAMLLEGSDGGVDRREGRKHAWC